MSFTNIYDAVLDGTVKDVQYFIEKDKAVLNAKNINGGTPLFTAVFQMVSQGLSGGKIDLSIVEYLLSAGADVNEYFDGQTILLIALRFHANSAIIKLLVNNGADVDKADKNNKYSQSSLHSAAELIDLDNETASLIVSKSKKIDLQDVYGNTPLHQACMVGNVEMVKLLLSHCANINKKNNMEATPLHMAVAKEQIGCVKYLISKGANVNATEEDNWTPLHCAAQTGNVEIARILVDGGVNTSARTYKGSTALMMAKQFGHYSLESYLSSRTYY